ncbi:MAG: hypothetical protein V5A62_05770 [Haloarculaceae archaeon]
MVSLNAQDTVPDQYDIDIEVEVVHAEFNEDGPAVIRVTTTNHGEPVGLSIGTGYCSMFDRRKCGSDEPPGLWLHRPESHGSDREDGRWTADRPPTDPRRFPDVGCTMQTYRGGQSVSSTYQVWDDYRKRGYLVPDTYRWEEAVRISDATSETDSGEESFEWGFSLRLER